LVIQATAIGQSGQVLVLDMGEPVRIVDLARTMIRLAGKTERQIAIEFSGLRAGEKLFEELLADADSTLATPFRQLRIAQLESRDAPLAELLQLAGTADCALGDAAVRAALAAAVPEYRPT
jgi:FlaA1/EpsC-like NDP-sugar epimerase